MCKILDRRATYYSGTYGVDFWEMVNRLESIGGKCELCGKSITFTGSKVTARLDHCHVTGKVRGILCNCCNKALGMFGDDKAGFYRMLRYVESRHYV